MLKSVHITNYYHEKSGGVSTSYNNLLAAGNRLGREVRLIVPGEESKTVEVGEFGKIYFVKAKPSPFFDSRYRVLSPFHYVQDNTPIRNILLQEKPDLIEIYDNSTLTFLAGMIRRGYMRQLNRPMLVYFTGERLDTIVNSFILSGKKGEWFSRRAMGNGHLALFDFYIAASNYIAEELYDSVYEHANPKRSRWFFNKCWQFLRGAPVPFPERVRICPRGVDTSQFGPHRRSNEKMKEFRERYNLPENAVVLLSSTRISPEKNVTLLPQMMKELANDASADYRLLIAGDGPLVMQIEAESERAAPGKVILTGHIDKQVLADLYANADIFVHPNPREPFGNVGLEAMASGIPFVGPNSGGVLSYANEQNAWLGEATGAAFAELVRSATSNPSERMKRSELALETAAANTREKATDRVFATYDELFEIFKERNAEFTETTPAKIDFARLHSSQS